MPSSISRRASFDSAGRQAARWAAVAAGPLVWAAVLQTNYVLSYVACEQGSNWMLHLATLVAVAIVLVAAVGGWHARPTLGNESESSTEEERTALLRARFLTYAGLGLCGWFTLVILAMEVPASLLQACNP